MPRKQWVVVKAERTEDDDLIVVSGEEGGDEEEDEDDREVELSRDRNDFSISNVRSLSAENDMDSQVSRQHVQRDPTRRGIECVCVCTRRSTTASPQKTTSSLKAV